MPPSARWTAQSPLDPCARANGLTYGNDAESPAAVTTEMSCLFVGEHLADGSVRYAGSTTCSPVSTAVTLNAIAGRRALRASSAHLASVGIATVWPRVNCHVHPCCIAQLRSYVGGTHGSKAR